jgi:hypothetical protein
MKYIPSTKNPFHHCARLFRSWSSGRQMSECREEDNRLNGKPLHEKTDLEQTSAWSFKQQESDAGRKTAEEMSGMTLHDRKEELALVCDQNNAISRAIRTSKSTRFSDSHINIRYFALMPWCVLASQYEWRNTVAAKRKMNRTKSCASQIGFRRQGRYSRFPCLTRFPHKPGWYLLDGFLFNGWEMWKGKAHMYLYLFMIWRT